MASRQRWFLQRALKHLAAAKACHQQWEHPVGVVPRVRSTRATRPSVKQPDACGLWLDARLSLHDHHVFSCAPKNRGFGRVVFWKVGRCASSRFLQVDSLTVGLKVSPTRVGSRPEAVRLAIAVVCGAVVGAFDNWAAQLEASPTAALAVSTSLCSLGAWPWTRVTQPVIRA